MSHLLPLVLATIPILPLLAGLAARTVGPVMAGRLVTMSAGVAAVCAVAAAGALALGGPVTARWAPWGDEAAFTFSIRLDALTAAMTVLVSLLGLVTLRFSRNYLAGDPGQARFFSWMSLTLASVLLLVLSGNLLLLLFAWIATSMGLHRLLLHYPDRAGAHFSVRKKFVFSRLGDLCLAAAIVLVYRHFGTWELDALFAEVAAGRTGGLIPVGFLLAGCAILKSAQLPFHSWLPDTMETPTPVSAFMHAGIINAGGFLLVRLSPLLMHSPGAMALLAVVGAVTAVFGSIVMLAQVNVKRALAYSTIAQMGFMILQCGLGAFSLAVIHILAHALYKAHAFLTSGSTVGALPRTAIPLSTRAIVIGLLGSFFVVMAVAGLGLGFAPQQSGSSAVFLAVLALALAYGLARAASAGGGKRLVLRAVTGAAFIAVVSLVLHGAAAWLFPDFPVSSPPGALIGFVAGVFVLLFLFQALLWRASHHEVGRRLYLHALNGFYLGTQANRLLGHLWPRHSTL